MNSLFECMIESRQREGGQQNGSDRSTMRGFTVAAWLLSNCPICLLNQNKDSLPVDAFVKEIGCGDLKVTSRRFSAFSCPPMVPSAMLTSCLLQADYNGCRYAVLLIIGNNYLI